MTQPILSGQTGWFKNFEKTAKRLQLSFSLVQFTKTVGVFWNDRNNEIDAVYFDNNQDILSFSWKQIQAVIA